jgi:hypothetical protein
MTAVGPPTPVTAFRESTPMKRLHRAAAVAAALIGALALSLAACSTDVAPSAPRAPELGTPTPPANDLLGLGGTLSGVTGTVSNLLLYRCPTDGYGSVTRLIGPAGGTIKVGPHSLVIPAGALASTVAITATAPAGQYVKVDFQPAGLRFSTSATLRLSYAECAGLPPLLPKVVYLNDLLSILEVLPSLNDLANERVTAKVRHFSGYAIAD